MGQRLRTVAVCTSSHALTAILSAVLAGKAGLRVRQFESKAGLATYMRLAPVSLLVCDIEDSEMVSALRHDERLMERDFETIALTRTLTRKERQAAVDAGIDEVILKPMSPSYLLERVIHRLDRSAQKAALAGGQPERRKQQRQPADGYRRLSDNVVQLFPPSWQPNP